MLEEALNRLIDLAVKAAGPFQVDVSSTHTRYHHDGKPVYTRIPAPPLVQRATSLATIAARVAYMLEIGNNPSIWIHPDQIIALYDDIDPRQFIRLELTPTDVWQSIRRIEGETLNQRAAVEVFYHELGDYAGDLHEILRSVNFTLQADEQRILQRDRESLGNSITKFISAHMAIPKTVELRVPVHVLPDLPTLTVPIVLFLNPDLDQRGLRIELAPDNVHHAIMTVTAAYAANLRGNLGEADVPIYFGRPF